MRKKYFNWEDLGLGTIEQLSVDWGIPVEQLEEEQYKEHEKSKVEEEPTEEEIQKAQGALKELDKTLDRVSKILKEGRTDEVEGDLADIS